MMDDPVFAETFEMVKRESDALLAQHGYARDGGATASCRAIRTRSRCFVMVG